MDEDIGPDVDYDESVDLCFPLCPANMKPYVGQFFNVLEDGYDFYDHYAAVCGFITRKYTVGRTEDGTIHTRYMMCNRQGVRKKPDPLLMGSSSKTSLKRNRTSCKADCRARIVFQISTGGLYEVTIFIEGHTHSMAPSASRHLMVSNRKLEPMHEHFIMSGVKANIGTMRTFRFFKEIFGTYDSVGCTSLDFKNFVCDLRVFCKGSDANMIIDAFKNKHELSDGFTYYYDIDEENRLTRLFWADGVSVKNYKMFGEAVSFDATYNTNRYKMIFTPFAGRDNHGKCMSFGAALISREDMDSYVWVLNKFVECMGQPPRLFITNQDLGLKKAIQLVWPNTLHRYCMWHITMKVAEKVPIRLRNDSDFKTKFGNIVWNDLDEPSTFEKNWMSMIDEFDLCDNRWFSDIYEERTSWIPAYFRDVPMSGLFRTTSLSESENSYFKRFINKHSVLVVLSMNYSSGVDAQREIYNKFNLSDERETPALISELKIESHASTLFTNTIFKEVQGEIHASLFDCSICNVELTGVVNSYVVEDNVGGVFNVSYDCSQDYLICSCRLFVRRGIICRHMFTVMKSLKLDKIPDKYVVKRWCKLSIISPDDTNMHVNGCGSLHQPSASQRLMRVISQCITLVSGDDEKTERLICELSELTKKFPVDGSSKSPALQKKDRFVEFYGASPSDDPDVLPPQIVKTKGSGAGDRRKSNLEKAQILAQKPLRKCRKCDTMAHHDSRNCPGKEVLKN